MGQIADSLRYGALQSETIEIQTGKARAQESHRWIYDSRRAVDVGFGDTGRHIDAVYTIRAAQTDEISGDTGLHGS